jgi:hypothetical protein
MEKEKDKKFFPSELIELISKYILEPQNICKLGLKKIKKRIIE